LGTEHQPAQLAGRLAEQSRGRAAVAGPGPTPPGGHPAAFPTPSVPGGTVGAVAIDARGLIAAGTSTGGSSGKRVGRVGDSALVGCGAYADNRLGGVSTTGHGEAFIRPVLAKTAPALLR